MTWLFVVQYQKQIFTQHILSLGSQRVIPLRLLLISDGLLRKKVLVSIKKHYRLHTKGNVLWCTYLSCGTSNSCPIFMLLKYITLKVSYFSLRVTISYVLPQNKQNIKRQLSPHKHWHISSHRQQQDTTISVCCNQWTNKEAWISVFHKRHQLKAWFIISSMPLLPIKDSDGDKEASTAGRQQTDKTKWQPRAWCLKVTRLLHKPLLESLFLNPAERYIKACQVQ